jgi:hypothetical protein
MSHPIIGPHRKVGRKPDILRHGLMRRYGMSGRKAYLRLTPEFIAQLDCCASEEARRLILGVKPPAAVESNSPR